MAWPTRCSRARASLTLIASLLLAAPAPAAEQGQLAPAFELPGIHRATESIALTDYRGQVVWLDFWATWCAPCKQSLPAFEKIYEELGPRGFTVIGVNVDERPKRVVGRFVAGMQLSFPLVSDRNLETSRAYGVQTMPTAFLIGADGHVIHEHTGFRKGDSKLTRELIVQALDARGAAARKGPAVESDA